MDNRRLFNISFFVLLALMLYLALRLLWPSIGALLGAVVLAIVFYPVHLWMERYIPNRSLRALFSDLFVIIFVFLPLTWLVWAALHQADTLIPIIQPVAEGMTQWIQSAPANVFSGLAKKFPWLSDQLGGQSLALQTYLATLNARSITWLAKFGAQAAQTLWLVSLAIVALFFFFRDGPDLVLTINGLLPLKEDIKLRIEERVRRMIIGAARGAILTSMAQGIVATIGFLIIGTPSAFLLGFLTLIMAVIPIVGSALIWAPISMYYFWSGSLWKGGFMLVWGLVVIGLIDNLLRPWLVGIKQDISFFWLFFAIVGGLQVFGLFGVLIGPLIMAVLTILLDVYQQVYLEPRAPDIFTSDRRSG